MCLNSMRAMNIFKKVRTWFINIHIWGLADRLRREKSYIHPTLEFLSTIHVEGGVKSFAIYNKGYNMLDHEINEELGTLKSGHTDYLPRMVRQAFWEEIFMKVDNQHPKNAHHIMEVSLRCAQIILANSIFATGETNNEVTERDIFLL